MATAFKMPQLGETVIEGTITRWLKKEGETVEADEPLVEISTDKVDSEIPAPVAGTVSKINFQEGDTVKVGEVIAEIGDASGAAAPQAEAPEAQAPETTAPQEPETKPTEQPEAEAPAASTKPAAEANGTQAAAGDRPAEEAPPQPPTSSGPRADEGQSTEAPAEPGPEQAGPAHSRRGILSPLVRRLASQYKVDLSTIKGTGTGGRITKQDVLAAAGQAPAAEQAAGGALDEQESSRPAASGISAQQTQSTPAAPAQPPAAAPSAPSAPSVRAPAASGDEVVQVTTMRKSIAEHMVASLHETARAWNTIEIDLTNIARLREQAGPAFKQKEGFSLTWMPFVSKAVTQALQRYPQVNATWNGDGTITRKHYVNLGIAVALENGLIVPVVKGADGMNIVGLARGVRDVATRARSKKLVPDDVQGGTFTITNPGPFGSILSVPIINKGQAAILAFDAVVKRPVVVTDEHGNDSIAIRHMVFISMSWDHRVIDGAEAAQFLAYLKELLEEADYSSDISGYLPGS